MKNDLATRAGRLLVWLFACGLIATGTACQRGDRSSSRAALTQICKQPIPHSQQSLFEVQFAGDWAFTSDPWGYVISDSPDHVTVAALTDLPKGRLFKIDGDGTIHIASFADYEPRVGEKTTRHVVHGVPVVETVFNSDGNGWSRDPDRFFEAIELADDHLSFINARDDQGVLLAARQDVDAGSIVARVKDGLVQSLQLHRIEPDPAHSPASTKRRLSYQTWTPAPGHTLSLEQLPTRGICKPSPK